MILTWDTSLFYSKNENKVEDLTDGLENFTYNTSSDDNIAVKATVGGSIGDIYGKVLTGETDATGAPMHLQLQQNFLEMHRA